MDVVQQVAALPFGHAVAALSFADAAPVVVGHYANYCLKVVGSEAAPASYPAVCLVACELDSCADLRPDQLSRDPTNA